MVKKRKYFLSSEGVKSLIEYSEKFNADVLDLEKRITDTNNKITEIREYYGPSLKSQYKEFVKSFFDDESLEDVRERLKGYIVNKKVLNKIICFFGVGILILLFIFLFQNLYEILI